MTKLDSAQRASLFRLLVGTAAVVIILAGMKAAAGILGTVLLGLFLTITITPLMFWMQRRGVPGWLALVLTMALVVVGFLLVVIFFGLSIAQLINALPAYEAELEELFGGTEELLGRYGVDSEDVFELSFLDPAALVATAVSFLNSMIGALGNSVLLLLVMAFMLLEATGFPIRLNRNLPPDSILLRNFSEFNRDIREYFFITSWTGLLAGALDVILLLVLGVEFAVLWGLLSFFLNFVPNIGFVLALIPPTLLALLQHGWPTALLVIIGYVIINGAIDSVMKPRVMGQGLNLSPLIVTVSLVFWAWVLGGLGAILAVPLTMMMKKLILESRADTAFMADLIGAGGEDDAEPGSTA